MVILFGSHARGDWVEDSQEHYEYVSDYHSRYDINYKSRKKNWNI